MNKKHKWLRVNDRAGLLLVIDAGPMTQNQGQALLCRCDCGNLCIYMSGYLTYKFLYVNTVSCGCLRRATRSQVAIKTKTTHGLRRSPEYLVWANMKNRTSNPNCKEYPYYGGRGIAVCEEWKESFKAFYEYVGPRPSPKHQIDRYPNNNGNYEPGNVRWATKSEQMLNRRKYGTCKIQIEDSRNAAQSKPESITTTPTTNAKGA